MPDYYKECKRGHQELQPRNQTRNNHDIKEPEKSPKNADARQTDNTPRQIHDQDNIYI